MAVLTGLASAGNGKGHVILFSAVADWLEVVKKYLVQKNVVEKLEAGNSSGRHMIMLENATTLLQYIRYLESNRILMDSEQHLTSLKNDYVRLGRN